MPRVFAQATSPQLLVGGNIAAVGSTVDIPVAVFPIDNGLSGFEFSLAVDNPAVMQVTRVTWFVGSAQSSVSGDISGFALADASNIWQAGTPFADLFTVQVLGIATGTAQLLVTPVQIDDDAGTPVVLTVQSTSVTFR